MDEYLYESDIGYTCVGFEVKFEDGCDFNPQNIVCPPNKRKRGQCERCGWNPKIARRRCYQIRKRMEGEDNARQSD